MASDIREALRIEVAERAGRRCEYCLIHEEDVGFALQVDHIISRKHGGLSIADTLAYACVLCNRNKGTDVASVELRSGLLVRLFHPRQDLWGHHFQIDGQAIEPLSERHSLQILGRYPTRWP